MASERQYLELYTRHRELIESHSVAALNARREAAAAFLRENGLPDSKTERYKYTDAEAAFAPDYGLNLRRTMPRKDPYKTFRCNVPNFSTTLLFVANDVPCPLPEGMSLPEGVSVGTLCGEAEKNPAFIEQYYHRAASRAADGVTALNTLLAQDGLLVRIAAGVKLKNPIQVVNVHDSTADLMCNRRVLVVAEEGAEASILFCNHAEGESRYLSTDVVEVYAAGSARLRLYAIEESGANCVHFCQIYAEQAAGSRVDVGNISLRGGLTRYQTDICLGGPQAEATAFAAVIAGGEERVDHNVLIEHAAPECTSDMLFKYVLDGKSTGAFAGKILVDPGAQKTLAHQTNANLCASPDARAYSQPMLEIYADDVKCNHGSTTGKLDETALFYMRQRGIDEREARLLLQHAFVNDVLLRVDVEHLRDRLSRLVELRFRGELDKCRGCNVCK